MKVKVCWHLNNWTNQGPGSIVVYCKVSSEGFDGYDERPGHHTNSGARVRFDTFEKFMELLDLCRDCVKRIKAGPQDVLGRVREMVSVDGKTANNRYVFYEYGSTSPRHSFSNINNPRSSLLARMINDYIEDVPDAPPAGVIRDYILDNVQPSNEY